MNLIDGLSDVAGTDCRVVFLDDQEVYPFGVLWEWTSTASRKLSSFASGGSVAMLLESTPHCIATFLGALRAGLQVLSLPLPPRGADPLWYADYLERVCSEAFVQVVAVGRDLLPMIPASTTFAVKAFDELTSGPKVRAVDRSGATLVQFTSGSTSDPSGIVLSLAQLEANVSEIVDVLQPGPGDVAVSWLPLSHDMGLVGMLLTSLAAAHPSRVGGGTIGLMQPTTFIRSPWRWLQACSELQATVTSAPNFALDLAVMSSNRLGSVDLSHVRSCIVGGETVSAPSLRSFEETYGGAGFSETAFSPAYGMAEAVLAVCMTPTDERWRTASLDLSGLADGDVQVVEDGREFVCVGPPLPSVSVEIEGPRQVGQIILDGPTVSRQRLGASDATGPLRTGDQGALVDGYLVVSGRIDDVVNVSGRKVWLVDVDAAITSTGLTLPGRGISVVDEHGTLVAALEVSPELSTREVARVVSSQVSKRTGVALGSIAIFARNSLPRTTSGKPRRKAVCEQISKRGPGVLQVLDGGGGPRGFV